MKRELEVIIDELGYVTGPGEWSEDNHFVTMPTEYVIEELLSDMEYIWDKGKVRITLELLD